MQLLAHRKQNLVKLLCSFDRSSMSQIEEKVMQFLSSTASFFKQCLKGVFVVLACAVMLFSSSLPAYAIGTQTPSSPSKGTAELDQVHQQSKNAVKGQPQSRAEVQSRANQGLNGVQGSAANENMNRPSDSGNANTVMDDVEDAFESITK